MEHSKSKLAIIDIGSNTVRLVIYHKNEFGKFKEIENVKSSARLRHYLNEDGVMEKYAIHLLVEILKGFKEILDFHHVKNITIVATAAIRQAENKQEVLSIVKEQTGFEIRILSEAEEAFYGYFAVIHSTSLDDGVTIDLGGGSTEITFYQNRKLMHSHSFSFGVVSLKEKFIKGEKITVEEKRDLLQFLEESFQSIPWLKNLQVPIIAIGGSARNIAQIDQNLKKYPLSGIHQYRMMLQDLKHLLHTVEMLNASQVEKLEGIAKDRADIIFPALGVFTVLCDFVQTETFIFSRKGLRDGILLRELECDENNIHTDYIVKASIDKLVHGYDISSEHANHVADLAQQIYTQVEKICRIQLSSETKKMIDLSAHVYNFGQYIDSDDSSQHTFYLLANKSIDGLEHKQRVKLALIASYKSKALFKQFVNPFINWFTRNELQAIRIAGALTKLAAALDASKRAIVKGVYLQKTNDEEVLAITLKCSGNAFVEKYQAEKQIRHLEKAIKKKIQLKFADSSSYFL